MRHVSSFWNVYCAKDSSRSLHLLQLLTHHLHPHWTELERLDYLKIIGISQHNISEPALLNTIFLSRPLNIIFLSRPLKRFWHRLAFSVAWCNHKCLHEALPRPDWVLAPRHTFSQCTSREVCAAGLQKNFILIIIWWSGVWSEFSRQKSISTGSWNFLKPAALWGREGPDMREAAKTHDKDLY